MDDLDLNLEELDAIEASADNKLKVKNRFQVLSDKVKSEAQAREQAEAKFKEQSDALSKAEKETQFLKTFNQLSSKHPEASNYQDQILERVNKGYDPEEAVLAVLAKEGKLNVAQPAQRQVQAEGGSAINNVAEGDKSFKDMSETDKLSVLEEAERSGELAQALRNMR